MGFFTRTKRLPALTETDPLAAVEKEYQAAKAAHIAASEAVDQYRRTQQCLATVPREKRQDVHCGWWFTGGAALDGLERVEHEGMRIRNERMHERAEFRMNLGLVR
jgi:hypothetical protein